MNGNLWCVRVMRGEYKYELLHIIINPAISKLFVFSAIHHS